MIAVPTRGSIRWETVTRLQEIRDAHPGLPPVRFVPGSLSVAITRNRIVSQYLQTNDDVLIMVDDDIVPPPHMLEALLPHVGEYGAVAIPHSAPAPDNPSCLILTAYENGFPADLVQGINEVDTVATGCIAISRKAIEALAPNPFRIGNDPDADSDDFEFCKDLRTLGFKIGAWYDGWICDHVTTIMSAPLWEVSK
jgi:hypothetical protein